MSSHAFGWAWRQSLPPAEKMVLLALADVASPDQDRFPCPASYIVKISGMAADEIADAVSRLTEKGLVSYSHGVYRLGMPPTEPAAPPSVVNGCLYVMVSGGKTKVGISKEVNRRLASIKTTLPDIELVHTFPMTMPDARLREAECLGHFAGDFLHGEWISTPAKTVVEHLQLITGQKGVPNNG